jgi:protein involved in polysaccharide export with SLBB domain
MTVGTANIGKYRKTAEYSLKQTGILRIIGTVGLLLLCLGLSGCTALLSPISGVPAHRLPAQFHAKPKNNLKPIDIYRLRQEPPAAYLIDAGDILGVWIQGVLGDEGETLPFQLPEGDSDLPPAIGYPIIVREDGSISLPFVEPIQVNGLTLRQVEESIRRAYTVDRQILVAGKDRIIVTLMRERTHRVIVLRRDNQDLEVPGLGEVERQVIRLPAYKNDVLHALAETGGLPGLDAKNEVLVIRGSLIDAQRRDAFVKQFYENRPCDPCLCLPDVPEDCAIVRIPLRLPPGETPQFRPEDVILEEGDIVLIEGREREVYYTSGLLGGGEHELPRDYDLDVITAMAKSGGLRFAGSGGRGGGMGGGGMGGGGRMGGGWMVPPGQLFIIRKTPCGDQITIDVDLNRAIRDPRSRPLIEAGDILVLQYRPQEELVNFGIATFFTYGIAELIGGRR